jgi:hypothetical protein
MIMKKPRWPIFAGVLCFAAVFGGRAGAAEVYPGCAVPPTTFNHIWYIDPVNGQTEAGMTAAGIPRPETGTGPTPTTQGSAAHPWNSLQGVFTPIAGGSYLYPLLSTAPYLHNTGKSYELVLGPNAGPIQPGDEILLMSGHYGDISTGDWNVGLKNTLCFRGSRSREPRTVRLCTPGNLWFWPAASCRSRI